MFGKQACFHIGLNSFTKHILYSRKQENMAWSFPEKNISTILMNKDVFFHCGFEPPVELIVNCEYCDLWLINYVQLQHCLWKMCLESWYSDKLWMDASATFHV